MREGRGLEEGKLHGRCPGTVALPLPTEPFQWRQLPDIVDQSDISRPFVDPKLCVLPAWGDPEPDSEPRLVCHSAHCCSANGLCPC